MPLHKDGDVLELMNKCKIELPDEFDTLEREASIAGMVKLTRL